jgi:hypothetical protein
MLVPQAEVQVLAGTKALPEGGQSSKLAADVVHRLFWLNSVKLKPGQTRVAFSGARHPRTEAGSITQCNPQPAQKA